MAKQKKSTFERLRSGTMNRQQRRDLGRRLAGNDPSLTIVHPNAGGIDVGNESHFVAVPPDRDPNPVQEFGCWTADLKRMAAFVGPIVAASEIEEILWLDPVPPQPAGLAPLTRDSVLSLALTLIRAWD